MKVHLCRSSGLAVVGMCLFIAMPTGCGKKGDPYPLKLDPTAKGVDVSLEPKDWAKITIVGKAYLVTAGMDQNSKPEGNVQLVANGVEYSVRTPGQLGWVPGQKESENETLLLMKAEAVVADVEARTLKKDIQYIGKVRVRTETDPPPGTAVVEGVSMQMEVDEGNGKQTVLAVKNGSEPPIIVRGKIGLEPIKGTVRVSGELTLIKGEFFLRASKVESVQK
jgi:hypothetical protein